MILNLCELEWARLVLVTLALVRELTNICVLFRNFFLIQELLIDSENSGEEFSI